MNKVLFDDAVEMSILSFKAKLFVKDSNDIIRNFDEEHLKKAFDLYSFVNDVSSFIEKNKLSYDECYIYYKRLAKLIVDESLDIGRWLVAQDHLYDEKDGFPQLKLLAFQKSSGRIAHYLFDAQRQIKENKLLATNRTNLSETKMNSDKYIKLKEGLDVKGMAYFFWKLKEENIIESVELGAVLASLFRDNAGKEIKNTLLNKYFSQFSKGEDYSKYSVQLDKLINKLK